MKWSALCLLAVLPAVSSAEIYRCQAGGSVVFSDTPCGADARVVEVDPVQVGGRLDTGTDVDFYSSPNRRAAPASGCPHISSTELRRLAVQRKVVTGMKPADVRRAWGGPSSVRTSGRFTQWAFHWPNGNHQFVYFQGGCVSSTSTHKRF